MRKQFENPDLNFILIFEITDCDLKSGNAIRKLGMNDGACYN